MVTKKEIYAGKRKVILLDIVDYKSHEKSHKEINNIHKLNIFIKHAYRFCSPMFFIPFFPLFVLVPLHNLVGKVVRVLFLHYRDSIFFVKCLIVYLQKERIII